MKKAYEPVGQCSEDLKGSKVKKHAKENPMSESDLRSKLIRLAHTNPELREQILPLVREANNGYNQAVKEIEQLIAFSKEFQALVNDRKHGGFTKSHTRLVAEFLKTLNDEILQLDEAYQLGYTPKTRR